MAFYDRAWMTIASGPNPLVLGSAVAGFRTFAAAGLADQATSSYTIIDGTFWETGQGTYTASGTKFGRRVQANSNGDTTIYPLSANATIFLDVLATDLNVFASLIVATVQRFAGALAAPLISAGAGSYPATITTDTGTLSNMSIGSGAGAANSTGGNNVAIGTQALGGLTSGGGNTALGVQAGRVLTTGASNAFLGQGAGQQITTGSGNTLVGYSAGSGLSGADANNTIVGPYAAAAGSSGIVVLADGGGNARFLWNGTINTITGNAAFTGSVSAPSATISSAGAPALTITSHNVYGGNETYGGVYSIATQDDINGPGWAIGLSGVAVTGANNPSSTTGRTWGLYGGAPSTNGAGGAVNMGVVAHSAAGYAYGAYNAARNGWLFFVNGQSGHITPGSTDNVATIGTASNRYSTVFAGTNTINTSDKTLKTVRSTTLTDQERAWAKSIAVVAYQFNDAIAEKGVDGARMHWGVLAQDVYQAGLDAGIADPMHYAFLCRDPLTVHRQEIETVPTRVPAMEAVQEPQTTIEMIDGRAVQRVVMVPVERQIIDSFPVYDESGAQITRVEQPFVAGTPAAAEVRNDAGEVVQAAVAAVPDVPEVRVPIMHDVPRLIDGTVEVARDITEPVLDANGAQVLRWGIRYTELLMFLLACQTRAAG